MAKHNPSTRRALARSQKYRIKAGMRKREQRSRARAVRHREKQAALGSGAALLLIALVLVGGGMPDAESTTEAPPGPETCADMIDNDGDGFADALDPECDPGNPGYDGVEDGDA